ncbi:capsule polysaccharide biosynthesis [Fusarium mexicanum]|uniref:Capsule polysaccharide biosynthesis n=1 Tax=Fusarium mexicanum TaxID=751941 RepID=A0A8H5MJ49_9HYPO|nr:capsule polysaccharide biosynthesis [Fusarium mexicanum]
MHFAIPPEYQSELEATEPVDLRTDEDMISSIEQYKPVTSEKNIWAFWDSGIRAIPPWCQRNVIGWARICGADWTIRVLDMVPNSPNHVLKFVDREMLPEAFLSGTMDGQHAGQHSADCIRGPLLLRYGGISMDVGCLLIRHVDRICWDLLADPASPYEIAVPVLYDQTIANHFVAARKNNVFIEKWHQLFLHLWNGRTNQQGISDSPLLGFIKDIRYDDATDFHWDWKVPVTQFLEYIAQVLCWQRLCLVRDTGDGFKSSEYWQLNILCIDALNEVWGGEKVLGFDGIGPRMYNLLTVRLDADTDSKDYKDAYKLVWRLLAKSSFQKVTRAKNLTHTPHLGTLWDQNEGQDCVPGSFGELLRYGAVHFRQKRESIEQKDACEPRTLIEKGLLGA